MSQHDRIISNSAPLKQLVKIGDNREAIEGFIDKIAEEEGVELKNIKYIGKSDNFDPNDGLVTDNFKIHKKQQNDVDLSLDSDVNSENRNEENKGDLDNVDLNLNTTGQNSGNGDTRKTRSTSKSSGTKQITKDATKDSTKDSTKDNSKSGDITIKRRLTDHIVVGENDGDYSLNKNYVVNIDGEYKNATIISRSSDNIYLFINPDVVDVTDISRDKYEVSAGGSKNTADTHKSFEDNVSLDPDSGYEKKVSGASYLLSVVPIIPSIALFYLARTRNEDENLFSKKVALNILDFQITYAVYLGILLVVVPEFFAYGLIIYVLLALIGAFLGFTGSAFSPPVTIGDLFR